MDESLRLPPGLESRLAHIPPGALDFDPVPVKPRHDGWTPHAQKMFVLALAAGLGVSGAARAVGKSRQAAYRLRDRPNAADFASACDRALRPSPSVPARHDRLGTRRGGRDRPNPLSRPNRRLAPQILRQDARPASRGGRSLARGSEMTPFRIKVVTFAHVTASWKRR